MNANEPNVENFQILKLLNSTESPPISGALKSYWNSTLSSPPLASIKFFEQRWLKLRMSRISPIPPISFDSGIVEFCSVTLEFGEVRVYDNYFKVRWKSDPEPRLTVWIYMRSEFCWSTSKCRVFNAEHFQWAIWVVKTRVLVFIQLNGRLITMSSINQLVFNLYRFFFLHIFQIHSR